MTTKTQDTINSIVADIQDLLNHTLFCTDPVRESIYETLCSDLERARDDLKFCDNVFDTISLANQIAHLKGAMKYLEDKYGYGV